MMGINIIKSLVLAKTHYRTISITKITSDHSHISYIISASIFSRPCLGFTTEVLIHIDVCDS